MSAFDRAWNVLKSAMAPADDEEEDWDDTDPRTTGIPLEDYEKEGRRQSGFIPRAYTGRENEKPNPFRGYKPDPTDPQGMNPSNPQPRFNPRDVEEDTHGLEIDPEDPDWNKGGSRLADYFTASSDKAFVDAWAITKQIA
jgi:hypothetical protein